MCTLIEIIALKNICSYSVTTERHRTHGLGNCKNFLESIAVIKCHALNHHLTPERAKIR